MHLKGRIQLGVAFWVYFNHRFSIAVHNKKKNNHHNKECISIEWMHQMDVLILKKRRLMERDHFNPITQVCKSIQHDEETQK